MSNEESEIITPEILYGLCDFCHRKFSEEVLPRHASVCKVLQTKHQRKVFNSGIQRATNSDIPLDKVIKPGKISRPTSTIQRVLSKKNNWRRKHLDLINILQSARGYKSSPVSKSSEKIERQLPVDYKMCKYCQRCFQEDVANKHMSFCKDIHLRMNFKETLKHPKATNKDLIRNEISPKYKYLKNKKKVSESYKPALELSSNNCINNSNLTSIKTQLEPLRTGRSENDYKNAINDLAIRFCVSRIPKSDAKIRDLKPIQNNGYKESSCNERNLQSAQSFVCKSRISNQDQGEWSPKTCNSLPREFRRESMKRVPLKLAKFCFHCGTQYTKSSDKYCYNCGTYRFVCD